MSERIDINVTGPVFLGYRIMTKDDGTKVKCPQYSSYSKDNDYTCIPIDEEKNI
jgi:hypothetical protein